MRFLVTGCAGFIGSHLTEALLDAGATVIGVDCFNDNYGRRRKLRNLESARDWDSFEFVPLDLARGDLHELVDEADAIVHLAAEPGVRSSWGARFDSYLRNNVVATQQLLEAVKDAPGKRFVYASSSSVYGQAEALPTREDAVPRPISPYGITKLTGEELAYCYHVNHGVDAVALRFFSVYGPRQRPDMAFDHFCDALLRRNPLTIYGDGLQTRDFTFVGDVVAAIQSAVHTPGVGGGIYNVGGGSQISVRDTLELLERLADRKADVQYLPQAHGDVRDTGSDISLAARDLGYAPRTAIEDGLRRQLEWVAAELAPA